jgi:hypothetical protein
LLTSALPRLGCRPLVRALIRGREPGVRGAVGALETYRFRIKSGHPDHKHQIRAGVLPTDTGPGLVFWEAWRILEKILESVSRTGPYSQAFSRASRTATGDPGLIARRMSSASFSPADRCLVVVPIDSGLERDPRVGRPALYWRVVVRAPVVPRYGGCHL